MRRVSLVRPASAPAINSDMAKTKAVATTAIRKRRRRHWRSRRLTNHMETSGFGSGVEPGLQGGREHHVPGQLQLAAHERLHAVELAGDKAQEVGQAEREGDPGRVRRALRPRTRPVVDLELVAVSAVSSRYVPLDEGALPGRSLGSLQTVHAR